MHLADEGCSSEGAEAARERGAQSATAHPQSPMSTHLPWLIG